LPSDIELPNEHPIHDPRFWSRVVEKYAGEYLGTAEEVLEYGADLLLRIHSKGFDHISDVVVASALFRQALVAFDGALLTMREGAVPACFGHVRTQLETDLYIDWILRHDKQTQGDKYFVGSLREQLYWARQAVPGTDEYTASEAAWEAFGVGPSYPEGHRNHAIEIADDVETQLSSERFRKCDERFRKKKGKRPTEPR